MQWIVVAAKVVELRFVRDADQFAVQPIGPRVIGTLNGAGKCAPVLCTNPRPPMPTQIQMRADLIILSAHNNHRLDADLPNAKIAGFG